MANEREIRGQIITQLANVYAHTPPPGELEEGAEPQPPWVDPDMPTWTADEIATAYTEVMGMFIYYAQEVESKHGPGFLEHLQRQALVNAADDEPSA